MYSQLAAKITGETYFVNKVLSARVASGRGGRKSWEYFTDWDGFGEDERTWEPPESFVGTQYAIDQFWKNANCNDGDLRRVSRMQEGHTIELKEEAPLLKRRKQKPGPGRSSEGLVPTGTRVFALWADDHHYYSGVIQRRVHDKYVVRYDSDGTEVALPLTDMRPCSKLLVGDSVLLIKDNVVLSDVGENGEVEITRSGKFSDIKISEYCIWRDWEGRELRRRDVVCAEDP